jgi:N-acetylmuramoyl-L-alanine amidase
MPAMLVEQAFMSNPEDEAKMLDPAFRAVMARAIRLGIEDWLKKAQHLTAP